MHTSYIYSVSRVNALSEFLLTKTDIERLLVAEPGEDLQSALKETYLAPYVAHAPEESVPLAIEQTLIDAKRLVHRLAPEGDMFRILWVQYDIHNLRVFAKAAAEGMSFEACAPYLSKRGIHEPEYLFAQVESNSLDSLYPGWQAAYGKAIQVVNAGELDRVDAIFDALYFSTCAYIIARLGDDFMKRYYANYVDLYNLKSRLRSLRNPQVSLETSFVDGGTFGKESIETKEQVFALFARLGGAEHWRSALDTYEATGNTTELDARIDDYMVSFAKEGSFDMFTSASLVLYYLKCRQAAANIRTIVVGKNSGMSDTDIRTNLRMAYVND